jgi:pimeloyl-ACP methyl ester carboxylesterase
MIKEWRIVVSGFRQDLTQPNGSEKLYKQLHDAHAGPDSAVEWKEWSQDWYALAAHMGRLKNGGEPVVDLFGYSYGGDGVIRLAQHLAGENISVRNMVLCDAVYRHTYWLGNWRSVFPWATLQIPVKVKNVYWLRQENPRFQFGRRGGWTQPAGHDVRALDATATTVHDPIILPYKHAGMDDCHEYHDLAMRVTGAGAIERDVA